MSNTQAIVEMLMSNWYRQEVESLNRIVAQLEERIRVLQRRNRHLTSMQNIMVRNIQDRRNYVLRLEGIVHEYFEINDTARLAYADTILFEDLEGEETELESIPSDEEGGRTNDIFGDL